LALYYTPGGKLVKFFFSGSPPLEPLELARGFLPASRDSFSGGVTSHYRKRFPAWFLLVPRERLGTIAFEAPDKMLSLKRRRGADYYLETELVVRRSTAAAREHSLRVA
jgi:hypothetical protein